MGEIFLYSVLTLFLPISLLLIFLEKRSRRIILSFLCGVIVCFVAYFINTYICNAVSFTNSNYSIILAPVVEECLKFIPILIFSIILNKGKRQTIAMSFALGVGFCVVENYYYLLSNLHEVGLFWVIIRCIGTGLMHSITSTLIGFGIYEGRIKNKTILFSLVALLIAILYHALYNFLVANSYTFIFGIFLPILSYIGLLVFLKNDVIKAFYE